MLCENPDRIGERLVALLVLSVDRLPGRKEECAPVVGSQSQVLEDFFVGQELGFPHHQHRLDDAEVEEKRLAEIGRLVVLLDIGREEASREFWSLRSWTEP